MPAIIASNLPLILCAGVMGLLGILAFNFLGTNQNFNRSKYAPNLHVKPARMIGRRGAALRDGADGMSCIQVDGVEWPVCSNDNAPIRQGEILEITALDGATLLAKKLVA